MTPPPPRSTLFPYTTLFRSGLCGVADQLAKLGNEPVRRTPAPVDIAVRVYHVPRVCCAAAVPAEADPARVTIEDSQVVRFERRSEEHTSELQSLTNLVCRLL